MLAFTHKAMQEQDHPLVLYKTAVSSRELSNKEKLINRYFCLVVIHMND